MATAEVQHEAPVTEAPKNPNEEGPRSFLAFLRALSDGEVESEGSYQLHELGKRLQETALLTRAKAKGKFSLSINLIADVNGTVGVAYNIETKAPKRPATPALFWLTKGGNLSAQDTRQLELRPRAVPSRGGDARDLGDASPAKEVP